MPQEPPQSKLERRINNSRVPVNALYLAFHIPARHDTRFYVADILSDILCNGPSSRLYRRLFKGTQLFSFIDCYITGSIDPGLLIVEAKLNEDVSFDDAKNAIWQELEILKNELVPQRELQKVKNKIESTLTFSELSVLNKAINLAYFELLGDASLINREVQFYRDITAEDIFDLSRQILTEENCSELFYQKNNNIGENGTGENVAGLEEIEAV